MINIFKKLIPHFMKVGGLYICSKMAWMMCGNEFPEKFFVQTHIS